MNQDSLATALNDSDSEARLAAIGEVTEHSHDALSEPALDALTGCLGANRKIIQRRAAGPAFKSLRQRIHRVKA